MIYIFNSEWFLRNQGFVTDNIGVLITPSERSIDIDSAADLVKAASYLKLKTLKGDPDENRTLDGR